MIKKSRLDLYLLNKGLCETRQKAQGLILAGKVRDINGKVLDKPGQQVLIGSEFFIDSEPMFVSRGGEKLLEALIRNNPKVILFERTNIRNLKPNDLLSRSNELPNFVVADLSFISLKLVFKSIGNLLEGDCIEGIFLIKPQFEVGKDKVSKGGVVRNPKFHTEAIESVIYAAKNFQWNIKNLIASPLVGPAGNHEYLAWMTLGSQSNKSINSEYIQNLVKETL